MTSCVEDQALRRGFLTALTCVALVLASTQPAVAASVSITGAEQTVFDWSQMACGPFDIPDGPARAFRDADNQVQLFRQSSTNRRMTGPDLDHFTNDCTVIKASAQDPFPWHFDDETWINASYTSDGTLVHALVHSEYRGSNHPGLCPSGVFGDCRYNTAVYATSTNGGDSYANTSPPTQLVASVPYPYVPEMGRVGVFSPSNIIEKDGYYYAMLLISADYRAQRNGACVMRTQTLSDPTSWRAWDGAGFSVRFIDPYLEPSADPEVHKCHPVAFQQIGQIERSLTYNSYLNKFFVIGSENKFNPATGKSPRGFYYSFSDDLIHWSDRQLLVETPTCVPGVPGGFQGAYPSVIDPSSTDRNFQSVGRTADLYFSRGNRPNPNSCATTTDVDLLRVAVEFAP
jgi:hypothetical protein